MGTTPKHVQHELSKLVKQAVNKGLVSPGDVEDYLLENGWTYSLPARQTIINILNKNNVEFVSGYWSKVTK